MSKPKPPEIPYIPNPAMRQIAVPIASLVLDPDNERKHDRANIDAIKGLIRKFGIMEPIGVREGLVIRGNGTTIALRELAAEKATALEPLSKMLADPAAPLDWSLVPALDYQHLDESAAAAWRVGHNRSAELGKWDWEKLQTTLRNTAVESRSDGSRPSSRRFSCRPPMDPRSTSTRRRKASTPIRSIRTIPTRTSSS